VNTASGPHLPRLVEAYSFDLFDTLLGRHFARPVDLFIEVERRLNGSSLGIESFARLRELGEFRLREKGNFQSEVTLEQIYSTLAGETNRNADWQRAAIEVELQVERESLFPIPAGLALLHRARDRRKKILFTSDTYFTRDFLLPLLSKFGIFMPSDRLYLSVESGLMKSTGKLFHHVASGEDIRPSRLFHIGDNDESDVRMARAAGWKAVNFRPTAPNRYEIPKANPETDAERLAQSLYHGMRRKLRLLDKAETLKNRTIFGTTVDIAGPLIITYTAWCLRQAAERGISRLYFLSRDGEILLKIAKRLNQRSKHPVRLHYLYVSRQSLLLPAMSDPIENELTWILAPTAVLTIRIALKRVDIAPEAIVDQLSPAGFPPETWDLQLTVDQRKALEQFILMPEFRYRLLQKAERARKIAIEYLEQNELMSDPAFALVDIGWRGTLQMCISRLLGSAGQTAPITGFYFGLLGTKRHKPEDEMVPFFSDSSNSSKVATLNSIVAVLEMFVAAKHGGVSGYRNVEGTVEPTFRTDQNENGLSWGLETQQRAILALTEALCAQPGFDVAAKAVNEDMVSNLEQFAHCPSHEEAQTYGAYLDAEDQNESVFTPIARPFSFRDLRRHRDEGYHHHHNEWSAAAVALTSSIYRRWLGVGNALERQHPVCGPGVTPATGFGPVEGPNREFQLARFFWAYGPECTLELDLPAFGRKSLAIDIKNYHGDQALKFIFGGNMIANIDIPVNLNDVDSDGYRAVIQLPDESGRHRLQLRPRHWSPDERPLAVIFNRIELCTSDT
jgi:predicted HAD superfamily hydrolase